MNIFNQKYISSTVVLRNGTEFPLTEVFKRNPSVYDIAGVKVGGMFPDVVSFAKGRSIWDGARWVLVSMSLGASDTFLCRMQ